MTCPPKLVFPHEAINNLVNVIIKVFISELHCDVRNCAFLLGDAMISFDALFWCVNDFLSPPLRGAAQTSWANSHKRAAENTTGGGDILRKEEINVF